MGQFYPPSHQFYPPSSDPLVALIASLFSDGREGCVIDCNNPLALFTDTARTTAATTDGQLVKGIADISGRGKSWSQATDAKAATLRIDASGNRWLEANGSTTWYASAAYVQNGTDGAQFACVAATTTSIAAGTPVLIGQDSIPRVAQICARSAAFFRAVSYSTVLDVTSDSASGSLIADTPFVGFVRHTGTTLEAFRNGATGGSTAVTGTPETGSTPLTLFNRTDAGASPWSGRLNFLLQAAGTCSSELQTLIQQIAASRSGVTL